MSAAIKACDVTLWRGSHQILANAFFEVAPTEVVAIVGPSGVGKSSLLAAIAGLIPCETGKLEVQGQVVGTKTPPIGKCVLMPQASSDLILPWRSVRGHLRLAGATEKNLDGIAGEVGLNDLLSERPGNLSGGQQRRLALATTFAASLPVVLLDEPFTGLDIDLTLRCWEFMEKCLTKRKAAVLFVTHSIEEAAILADRVFFLSSPTGQAQIEVIERNDTPDERAKSKQQSPSQRYRDMDDNGCEKYAKLLRQKVAKI